MTTRTLTIDDMNFGARRSISMEDAVRIEDPCVLYEGEKTDEEGQRVFIYTVGGWLDGRNIANQAGGCTVSGDVIIISAKDRREADVLAAEGFGDTIDMIRSEMFAQSLVNHGGSLGDVFSSARNAGIITNAEVRQKH